jgi:5-methylcytosine-specific restriction enzyme subunit McrC
MKSLLDDAEANPARKIGRIPVDNLWLLMLYASELTRISGAFDAIIDKDLDHIPDLIGRLLVHAVRQRLRRNFSRGYQQREMPLTRVRGRIDVLTTESRQLLSKGEVFCRYEALTIDTPRNRLIRTALELMARLARDQDLGRQSRALAKTLESMGVGRSRPSRAEMAIDQIGRNDSVDRSMIALAKLVFDMALPTENAGSTSLFAADRDEVWVRHLFERAVLGFARIELEPLGCGVRGGMALNWQVSSASEGLQRILPNMLTDIVLTAPQNDEYLIIDTKFTSILGKSRFGVERLKSGYLYQMYAYIRSQEGRDPKWNGAAGLFLHPAIDCQVYEQVMIQGHTITFAMVDLYAESAAMICKQLRKILTSNLSLRITN